MFKKNYFKGWYFKCSTADKTSALEQGKYQLTAKLPIAFCTKKSSYVILQAIWQASSSIFTNIALKKLALGIPRQAFLLIFRFNYVHILPPF